MIKQNDTIIVSSTSINMAVIFYLQFFFIVEVNDKLHFVFFSNNDSPVHLSIDDFMLHQVGTRFWMCESNREFLCQIKEKILYVTFSRVRSFNSYCHFTCFLFLKIKMSYEILSNITWDNLIHFLNLKGNIWKSSWRHYIHHEGHTILIGMTTFMRSHRTCMRIIKNQRSRRILRKVW